MKSPLAVAVRAGLVRRKNARKAAQLQTASGSAAPFYGVPEPEVRALCAAIFDAHPFTMAADWRRVIVELWDLASHREERYAALALAAYPPYQRFISLALLPLYRKMVQEGAAPDVVDPLAERMAMLLATYPDRIKPTLRAWARHESPWLRRVAITAQRDFGARTDLALLFDCVEPSLTAADPVLRSAIGLALREGGKAFPADIRRFLEGKGAELPAAIRREAMKGVQARRPVAAGPGRRAK